MKKWYLNPSKDSDCVFSVRIRIARNLSDFPFPNKMNDEQKYAVIQKVSDSIMNSPVGKDYKFVDIDKLSENEAFSLAERHLISLDFARNTKGRALILKNDESVSIMINEEDHIRIQSIHAGLEFNKAAEEALNIEKLIGKKLEFAFDNKFGFLTECPTNLGTGMRASAMMHLPALSKIGALEKLFSYVAKMGITVRGTFGEGSKAKSSMYQISNQVTLGLTEESTIENINSVVNQIVGKEKEARETFNRIQLEDSVCRALGTLKYARILSSDEFYNLISSVRLGASMGIIDIPIEVINELTLLSGAANTCVLSGGNLDSEQRDKVRAANVREKLSKYI